MALDLDVTVALRAFELRVGLSVGRETVVLAGPSGAGKTTVLRAVAGLRRPDAGRVALDEETWFDAARRVDLPPERRATGLVFQDLALFPHLTVAQNVAFGGAARAGELMERLRISALATARPGELSGGERQRVALARALAREPDVLLLDEPLSALDPHTRDVVRAELGELLRDAGLPAVLVTHDHRDAVALGDRIGVLVDGELRQLAEPHELARRPADAFVARFAGANVLEGRAERGAVVLDDGQVVAGLGGPDTGRVALAVAPWALRVQAEAPPDGTPAILGVVGGLTPEGDRVRVRLGTLVAEVPAGDARGLERGRPAWATFAAADARILPAR